MEEETPENTTPSAGGDEGGGYKIGGGLWTLRPEPDCPPSTRVFLCCCCARPRCTDNRRTHSHCENTQ
ncbi:hypothetical protein JOB18_013157 [Solea senegalensis]|uniref:Uncharacterized protein n=1 Tax=Solea senegalensis TaxID=28829 RepID=A0AAV6SC29_SOLSE|nr:hypothetical protein JOB18_013157 [Solea senegalensis]